MNTEWKASVAADGIGGGYTSLPKHNAVMDEYGRLDKSISELDELVSQLRARLDAVLTPELPTAINGIGSVGQEQQVSHLASRIRDDYTRVQFIDAKVRDILARLEI